jgi:hypothetical protein
MAQSFHIIIVDKSGTLKSVLVKDFKDEDLFKKCGFKKGEDFTRQVEWSIKHNGEKYFVSVYAKTDGRANSENKYDFPPPIDTKLFFGNCAIVAKLKKDDTFECTNLTVELWEKFYEKLFGGFEDLTLTCGDDEEEEDELANVPKEKKTKKGGYLKDGFVVDSDSTDEDEYESVDEDSNEDETEESDDTGEQCDNGEGEDFTCELVEEEYDYDAPVNKN